MARDRMSTRLTERMRETLDPHFKLASHASFDVQGWKVNLHDRLWHESPTKTKRMLKLLSQQTWQGGCRCASQSIATNPDSSHWVNPAYPGVRPGAEYHGNSGWLKNNGRDVRMGKGG